MTDCFCGTQLIVRCPGLSTVRDFTLPARCKWDFHSPDVTQRRLVDSDVSVPSSRTKPIEGATEKSSRNLGNYQSVLHNCPEERRSYIVHRNYFMLPLFKFQPNPIKLLKCNIRTIALSVCKYSINIPLLFLYTKL